MVTLLIKRTTHLVLPGHRLLKFFWTYRTSAQHVVYSLLIGRTVILAGDSQSETKAHRMITALSPLIPRAGPDPVRVLRYGIVLPLQIIFQI